ncbi:MAG: DEAD/DEAH box helicase [Deltaproteobacteria bacterium]|nr:DEAD/DEAH box helicase [Deltaproteobacteria bacterium]
MTSLKFPGNINLQRYLGKAAFAQATDYFKNGHVRDVKQTRRRVTAMVAGSGFLAYRVEIGLLDTGQVSDTACNCGAEAPCKHIGAVLLHTTQQESAPDLGAAVRAALNNPKKSRNNIIRLEPAAADLQLNSFVASLNSQPDCRPVGETDRRYRLIFEINEKACHSLDDYAENSWTIGPALVYLKQDGSTGRSETFREEKITEAPSPDEQQLLRLFSRRAYRPDDLRAYAELLIEHPDISLTLNHNGHTAPLQLRPFESARIDFKLIDLHKGTALFAPLLSLAVGGDGETAAAPNSFAALRSSQTLMIFDGTDKLLYCKSPPVFVDFLDTLISNQDSYSISDIKALSRFADERLPGLITVAFEAHDIRLTHALPQPFIEIERHSDALTKTALRFDYQGHIISGHETCLLIIHSTTGRRWSALNRNPDFENLVADYFQLFFRTLQQDQPEPDSCRYLNHEQAYLFSQPLDQFLIRCGRELIDNGIELRLKGSNKSLRPRQGRISLNLRTETDWFDARLIYREGKHREEVRIDPELLKQDLVKAGESITILCREDIERIRDLLGEGMDARGRLKISRYNISLIKEFSALMDDETGAVTKAGRIVDKLKNLQKIKNIPVSEHFNGRLRSYQRAGCNWLHFLHSNRINGCLADDMGLGKTVQTLAFLQSLKDKKALGTSLLVVPVSTIPNWENEARHFTPGLSLMRHAGTSRAREPVPLKQADLIVVSYHTLRNDVTLFRELDLDYIILDEAQNIKNAASRTFKAVRSLQARHRLNLTGTPVENSSLDLWSQMDFLNPGLLGTLKQFRSRYARTIEGQGDSAATERLQRRVMPFILRRRKEEVERELPEKEIITLYCEMEPAQRKIYNRYRDNYLQKITKTIDQKGLNRSAIEIFDALLRLRQIALFPRLVSDRYRSAPSCKFDALREMLDDIIQEQHKVLIFSQFVKPLQIFRQHARDLGLPYAYLDGSTKNRGEEIDRFQQDEDVRLFLLSLKAGGTGITLTAADYVVIFDPWWNPAVENQAIDRAHRIGQTHKVIAYKMIVRDSIEEKILALQEKKLALVKDLIRDDGSFLKQLSEQDVVDLFT